MAKSYRNAALVATAVLVRKGGLTVTDVTASNITTGTCWLHLYDAAAISAVNVGTTTPKRSFPVPLGDGTDYGVFAQSFPSGIDVADGLVVAATTTPTGSTAPGTGLVVTLGYV